MIVVYDTHLQKKNVFTLFCLVKTSAVVGRGVLCDNSSCKKQRLISPTKMKIQDPTEIYT